MLLILVLQHSPLLKEDKDINILRKYLGDLPTPKTYETVCEVVVVFNLPLIQADKALLCFADFLI